MMVAGMTPHAPSRSLAIPRAIAARVGALALASACLLPTLWPGDTPWVNDEPVLVGLALDANESGHLATHGLSGSRGWRYGPLPVWLLQASLLVSHNPIVLALLRSALFSLVLCVALQSIARRCHWPTWAAVPLVLSPYLWFYARGLWDNTWLIPLGAAAMALLAEWRETGRVVWLVLLLVCLWAMLMVHLMAVTLVAPILAYLIWFERTGLAGHKRVVAATIVALTLASAGYLRDARTNTWRNDGPRSVDKLASPLWGPRVLSSFGLDHFLGYDWLDADTPTRGSLLLLCNLESLIVVPLCWTGFVLSVAGGFRRRQREVWSTRDRLAALATACWIVQIAMHAVLNVPADPHYGNAVWIAYALLVWSAVDAAWKWSAARAAWLVHLAACALALTLVVARLHATGGTRSLGYGPTLRSQWEAVAQIGAHEPGGPVATNIEAWLAFPQAPETLFRLLGEASGDNSGIDSYAVVYRDERPDSGWLRVLRKPQVAP